MIDLLLLNFLGKDFKGENQLIHKRENMPETSENV